MKALFGASSRRQSTVAVEAVRPLLDAFDQPALVVDGHGVIVVANAGAETTLTADGQDLDGVPITGGDGLPWHEADRPLVAVALADALAGESRRVTAGLAAAGPGETVLDLTFKPWRGLGDERAAAIVTARPHAGGQPPPPGAPELLRTILDTVPVMVVWYDAAGRIRLLNRAFEQASGWTTEAVRGQGIMAACFPDPDYRAEVWAFMMNAGHEWRDFILTTRDGGTLESAWTNVRLSDGSQLGLGFDISERRARQRALERANAELDRRVEERTHALAKANAALREGQERLSAALAAAGAGTFRWDIPTRTVKWHDNLARLFRLSDGKTSGSVETFLALVHPEDRAAVAAGIERCATDGTDMRLEFRIVHPDGQVRWLLGRARTYRGEDGRPLYMTGACVDITERKEAEEQLNLLVAELDHRVKNTLAAIQSIAAHTRNHDGTVEGFITAFRGRLQAMAHAHGLLSRSRWAGVLLPELVRLILSPYDGAIAATGADLILKPKAALSLAMALHELATNAVKYGALSVSDGRVTVTWARDPADAATPLVLTWRESGGPPVRPLDHRGFGIELIERSLKHEVHGKAHLDFAPAGLNCRLVVPAEQVAGSATVLADENPRPAPVVPAPLGASRRILIAEDSLLIAMEVADTVEDLGWEPVGPASTVKDALDLVRRERLDGALLDVNLADGDAYPVADLLRSRGIPVIFVTGFETSRVLPEAYRALPCLQKPFEPTALQRLMAATFAAAGSGPAAAPAGSPS